MKQGLVRVVEIGPLWSNVQRVTFDAPEFAPLMHPGQLALVRDPMTFDPYLRRRLWLYQVRKDWVTLTVCPCNPPAARWDRGDLLDLLGPVGRAIEFDSNARHVLLIGEGARVAPLLAVAQAAAAQDRAVVLFARAVAGEENIPAHLLPPEIEYQSGGDLPGADLLTWADSIIAAGSEHMYSDLKDGIRLARYRLERGLARVLFDEAMPCGTGACHACGVQTNHGLRLACVDGPTFDLADWGVARAR